MKFVGALFNELVQDKIFTEGSDKAEIVIPRYRDTFSKLHAWRLTAYDSLLFLDSDTLVVGDIEPLLGMSGLLAAPGGGRAGPG